MFLFHWLVELKTQLPDIDLALCFSVWSSHFSRPVPKDLAILGEVGLTGEILPIAHLDRYISAMELLGISSCILPKQCEADWEKARKVTPLYVETIFDAYKLFNTPFLKTKSGSLILRSI